MNFIKSEWKGIHYRIFSACFECYEEIGEEQELWTLDMSNILQEREIPLIECSQHPHVDSRYFTPVLGINFVAFYFISIFIENLSSIDY